METIKEYKVIPDGHFENCDDHDWLSIGQIVEIREKFKEQGFDVTDEAIIHNYEAWCLDMKSGYRDDAADFFLFTPCGCNQLRFEACHLTGEDWQETYVA